MNFSSKNFGERPVIENFHALTMLQVDNFRVLENYIVLSINYGPRRNQIVILQKRAIALWWLQKPNLIKSIILMRILTLILVS